MATLQEQRDALEAAQKEAREARAWFQFLERHSSEILPCEANLQSARRYFNGEELSLQALEESFTAPAFR